MRLTLINASTSFMMGCFGATRTDQKALAVCAEYLVSRELKAIGRINVHPCQCSFHLYTEDERGDRVDDNSDTHGGLASMKQNV